MATITVRCPNGHGGQVRADLAGRWMRCRLCDARFPVPGGTARAAALALPPPLPPAPLPMHPAPVDLGVDVGPQKPPPWQWPAVPVVAILARISLLAGMAWAVIAFYHALSLWMIVVGVFLFAKFRARRQVKQQGGVYGSAQWAEAEELQRSGLLGLNGLVLGRGTPPRLGLWKAVKGLVFAHPLDSDRAVHYFVAVFSGGLLPASTRLSSVVSVPKGRYVHLLTVAPAGAGKGVGVIIPNLLNYPHSVVVVDPKGENYKATASHRMLHLGNTVVCLDPFHITGAESATFNPLDMLDATSPTLIDDVRALADALVVKSDKDQDPHWNESAATLISAVVLLVACHAKGAERSLAMVRQLLSSKQELEPAFKVMAASPAAGGMLRRLGGQMEALSEKEFSSVLSAANRHTNFLDSPLVEDNTRATSFDMNALATSRTSLYLVLPPQYIRSHSRLIRLWINCILHVLKNRGADERNEVLFLLDEVGQLGELQPLEEEVTLLRGYGIRIWFFLQSMSQLKVCFPGPRAEVLLSNFSVQQFFGVADLETAKHVSALVGKTTATAVQMQRGTSTSYSSGSSSSRQGSGSNSSRTSGTNAGTSDVPVERDLIRPEEVLRRPGSMFVFTGHNNPILADRLSYYQDSEFLALKATGRANEATGGVGTSWTAYAVCALALLVAFTVVDWHAAEATARQAWAGTGPRAGHVVIECSRCRRRGPIPVAYLGRRIQCRKCGTRLQIPFPTTR